MPRAGGLPSTIIHIEEFPMLEAELLDIDPEFKGKPIADTLDMVNRVRARIGLNAADMNDLVNVVTSETEEALCNG